MWGVIEDHSLFLVQQLLQGVQKKAKPLVTKVINPTRKKTTNTQQLVTQCCVKTVITLLVYCKLC